jgi:glycosyltransferase involved in cell wall biosynthesis
MDFYLFYLQNFVVWERIPVYQIVLYGAFALAFFVQLYYYLNVFRCATRYTPPPQAEQPPVSVVICSTNEHDNLARNLPIILQQKYPLFDVIVINDCSTDKTEELLSVMKMKYKNLYYSNVEANERFKHDRKLAITLGIKASQYEHIIFTAPDCTPTSNQWLAAMQAGFAAQADFVLGHCIYTNLTTTQRCDAIYTQLFAINAAIKGFPYKISYKNFGINKKMFLSKSGFANLSRFPNSEETLFVCNNATNKNTAINLSHDSITTSSQQFSLGQWWRQRTTLSSLFALGRRGQGVRHAEMLSRTIFYLCETAMVWLAVEDYVPAALAAIMIAPLTFIRLCLQISVYSRIKKVWNEKNIAAGLFFYDRWSPIMSALLALCRPNLYRKTHTTA